MDTSNPMTDNVLKKTKFKARLIALSIMLALILILSLIKRIEWVAEYVFARGISRAYAYVIGNVTSILPISVFEIFIYAAIITGIVFIVLIIKNLIKKRWIKLASSSLTVTIIVISVLLLYTVTASMNYYRAPVVLDMYDGGVDSDDYLSIGEYFLNDFNNLAASFERDEDNNIISPYTDRELAKIMREEFARLESSYYNSYVPLAKPILLSKFLSVNSLMGISFAPTAEPNINKDMPVCQKPFTMAHEIAHSLGVMRENEANLIASYITLTSKNDLIRYSGYLDTFYQIPSMIYWGVGSDAYSSFYEEFSPLIGIDRGICTEFWGSYSSFMNKISSFFNDIYLKLQGVDEGTGSYSGSYNYDIIDTGEINDEGQPVFEIVFSDVQKLYLLIYFDNLI
ncbi:MAG: DUF3810 domain-containing protein [Clostridia bacterium]|nr:DUF3810 domain-containing protein [Clostridia bacterium]